MGIANRFSAWNRARKWGQFIAVMSPNSSTTVLDVGFNAQEYSPVDNFLEKVYPFPENITALGVDAPAAFQQRYPKVKAVQYDGRLFPFADQSFDICWSNAVLEHVGNEADQLLFLSEIRRVAKRVFITTPNRHFPIEVHTRVPFLHWLPKPIFDGFLIFIGKGWAAGNYMNLLSYSQLDRLLREAGFTEHRLHRNRLAGFTLDFVIAHYGQSVG